MNKNNNKQIQEKIIQIESLIQNTKASLKSWANLIGKYHLQLKEFTNQLALLKKELNMKEKNTKGATK
ncbi:hypothetical protein [endosymbiont GvMRE of Glomus versiforme]|uniref:hypothetical protein n=1 Tax=endosymbiont GvMRE of Glomus versiforme TaxID=2039283 RepID=UPI000EE95BF2|nr:hypothetical protein [endosymbiont GvMRE of Glomus versiforme]RHZ36059.1 hypothetical protein GvMRE_Ic3g5 [endosymbiont GvMRE of Glomus versiforme]RHZ37049.1 hypothetical protein GvMRE_I2g13 [endosymbiont GvMRE of Glomus versiforme]